MGPLSVFNPFIPSGLFYLNYFDRYISNRKGVWLFSLFLLCFIEIRVIPVINANSVDPELHCLPMSLLWDARHKWVNKMF